VETGAPIADLFQSFGAGSRGVPRLQLAAFNRQYAGAVRDYNKHSAGEVTPKAGMALFPTLLLCVKTRFN
jgi:hypothetical protein